MITKPGIFLDMSAAAYFADPCVEPSLTQSIAKVLIERSPAHARLEHPRLRPADAHVEAESYVSAQAIGNAAHKLIIGRGKEIAIIVADNFRTKDAQETRDKASADGYVPILAKHHKAAKELCNVMRNQLNATGCLDAFCNGHGEVVVAAKDDGTWLRSMIDWMVSPRELYDLKTSGRSAAPHGVPNIMVDAGWDVQAAMQERILDLVDPAGAGRRTFRFVMVENEPPYALSVHELTESVMTLGRKKLEHAVRLWRICMETNTWPAYPPMINFPQYPGYAETKWLDREVAEVDDLRRVARKREPMLQDLSGG